MQRNFLKLLVVLPMFFLCFSYVHYASAIPATRTQNLKGEETSSLPSLAKVENVLEVGNSEEVLDNVDEGFIERRVDLETQDYEGTGANRDHEPKPPRRL